MSDQVTVFENFEGHPIEFRLDDALVDGALMCRAYGKRTYEFLRMKSTIAFIKALEESELKLRNSSVVTKEGRGGGTWMHPDLALELARWLDPKFAIWCNRVIRRLLAGVTVEVPASQVVAAGQFIVPQTLPEALRLAATQHERADQAEAKVLMIEGEKLLLEDHKAELEAQIEEDIPKREFFHAVAHTEGPLVSWNCVAKVFKVGRNGLLKHLREQEIVTLENLPYQKHMGDTKDLFRVKYPTFVNQRTGVLHQATPVTVVTGKGLIFLYKLLRFTGFLQSSDALIRIRDMHPELAKKINQVFTKEAAAAA